MSFSNIQTTTQSFSASGTHTVSHNTGGLANWAVVQLGQADRDVSNTASFDSVALTKYATARHGWFGTGDGRVSIFGLVGSWNGTYDFEVVLGAGSPVTGQARIITGLASGGNPVFVDASSSEGLNGSNSESYDSGVFDAIGFYATQHYNAGLGNTNGSLTVTDVFTASGAGINFMRDLTPSAGVQSASKGLTTSSATAWVVVEDSTIVGSPSPVTQTQVVTNPTVTGFGHIYVYTEAITQTQVVLNPSVTMGTPRAIPLVGVDVETPGRLSAPVGFTNPVLSYVGGVYTWVEASTMQRLPRRIVMRPNITDPPEPVADIDGDDYVYMEFED